MILKRIFVMFFILLSSCLMAFTNHRASAADLLIPVDAGSFYVEPDQASLLLWQVNEASGKQFSYEITDYQGQQVGQGVAVVENNTLQIPITLPMGYYEITLENQTFGMISQPRHTGETDGYFGMDVVLTWLERRADKRPVIVNMLKRSGIGWARDRFRWAGVNPKPGEFDWNEYDHADDVRKLYAAAGIRVLEMFHDGGSARGKFPVYSRFPQHLQYVPKNWAEIYKRWQSSWGALEVWNEPDGAYGSGLPADQYTPLVHAMHWAFRDRDPQSMPIAGGVLVGNNPGTYEDFLARNEMFSSVDFVSFHDYRRATQLQGLINDYRQWLGEYNQVGKPLWLTECGYPWPKGDGRAKRDDDANSAWQIVAKGAIAKACGVVRYFPFCMPFYEEGGAKSFSMIGQDLTPLRSMAAYVQLVRVLTGLDYVGDLKVKSEHDIKALVFAGQEVQDKLLVVLISSTLEPVSVTLPLMPTLVQAIDGRVVSSSQSVSIVDGMGYVYLQKQNAQRYLKTDTQTMQLYELSKSPEKTVLSATSVVLQYEPNVQQVSCSSARYVVLPGKETMLDLTIKVTNLDTRPIDTQLSLQLPGMTQAMKQSVSLEPSSIKRVHWQVDVSKVLSHARTKSVVLTAVAGGLPVSRKLALPFRLEGDLPTVLSAFSSAVHLPINVLDHWEKNITEHGKQEFVPTTEESSNGIDMHVRFTKSGDRWFYPKLTVGAKNFQNAEGVLIRVKAKRDAEVRIILFEQGGGGYWTNSPIVPADGQWHVAYISFAEFLPLPSHPDMHNGRLDVHQIKSLAPGMHDRSKELANTLSISDLILVHD